MRTSAWAMAVRASRSPAALRASARASRRIPFTGNSGSSSFCEIAPTSSATAASVRATPLPPYALLSTAMAASAATGPPKRTRVSARRPRRARPSASRVPARRTIRAEAIAPPSAAAASAGTTLVSASVTPIVSPAPAAPAHASARGGTASSRRLAPPIRSAVAPSAKSATAPQPAATTGAPDDAVASPITPKSASPSNNAGAPHASVTAATPAR